MSNSETNTTGTESKIPTSPSTWIATTSGLLEAGSQFFINVSATINDNLTLSTNDSIATIDDYEISFDNFTLTTTTIDRGDNYQTEFFYIFDQLPWLLWLIFIGVVAIIVTVIVIIVYCLIRNKKKVIRQRSSDEIFDPENYQSGCWPCMKRRLRDPHNIARQNSESNLSPYGRSGPLPPFVVQQPAGHPFHDSNLDHHFATHEDQLSDDGNLAGHILGIHIDRVKGIPEIPIAPENYRPLPQIRPQSYAFSEHRR